MRNRIKCRKCGDIIESTRHDYVTCKCKAVAVDRGGSSGYMRRMGNPADMEMLREWSRDPRDMCGNE